VVWETVNFEDFGASVSVFAHFLQTVPVLFAKFANCKIKGLIKLSTVSIEGNFENWKHSRVLIFVISCG